MDGRSSQHPLRTCRMADATWIDLERVREAVRSRATYFLENATYVEMRQEREDEGEWKRRC